MATTLRTRLEVNVGWDFNSVDADSSRTVTDSNSLSYVKTLANGVVIDTADIIWVDRRSVTSGVADDLDIAGGLTNSFGTAITFVKINAVIIKNLSTTAAEILSMGNGGANSWNAWCSSDTDVVKIGPDGLLMLMTPSLAGYAVTAGTGDILSITAATGTIEYDIALVGRSA